MASLPFDGQTDWGDILNNYLNVLSAEANSTQVSLQNHAGNSPTDPHGDRAYAQSLVAPFTVGLNTPNGLVKLNGSGTIPPALINTSSGIGGIYNCVVDAVTMFGATPNNGVDQSASLQAAMNFVSAAGGGIVYIGPGTFSVSSSIYIGSNTWVMMSQGTVIQRIPGSPNAPYVFTSIQLTTSGTPANNIMITGGTVNAVGSFNISSACTLIELFQGSGHTISDVSFYAPFGNSHAIEVNGTSSVQITNCLFNGVPGNASAPSNSCILVNASNSSTSPSGLNSSLYNGQQCSSILITNSNVQQVPGGSTYAAFGCLAGSDISSSSSIQPTGITITDCAFIAPATNGPIYTNNANWKQSLFSSNQWGNGKGTSSSLASTNSVAYDTWIQCSLTGSFSNGSYPLQYKISQDGTLWLFGNLNIPGSNYNNTTITTLPYHPSANLYSALAYYPPGDSAVSVRIDTSGRVTLQNAATGGISIFINSTFPVDYSGNGTI